MSNKIKVRIRPGFTHGKNREYGPGHELEVTPQEFEAFGDKFQRVRETEAVSENIVTVLTPASGGDPNDAQTNGDPNDAQTNPQAFDYEGKNVDQILAAVAEGLITADEALEKENERTKPRVTLVDALTGE